MICVATIVIAGVAASQDKHVNIADSGNDFLAICKSASDYTATSLTCFAFTQGFLEGLRASEELELAAPDKVKIRRICVTDTATVEQVLRVITKYIEENPERSDYPTRHLA